jgi:hypothetical protein
VPAERNRYATDTQFCVSSPHNKDMPMIAHNKLAITLLTVLAVHFFTHHAGAEDNPTKTLAGLDKITDPDNDCQFRSTITLTVPNTNHDLNPRRGMNAPRLLKKVTGDFTVQVKVTSDFKPGNASTGPGRPFNGAGLLAQLPQLRRRIFFSGMLQAVIAGLVSLEWL